MAKPPHPLRVALLERSTDELQALLRHLTGMDVHTTNRRYLVGHILSAAAARAVGSPVDDRPLDDLSVDELRRRYREVVGRDTTARDKGYLRAKIRDTLRGRVIAGPRTGRSLAEPSVEHDMLNFRFEPHLVRGMDAAWKRLGLRNRADMFRRALHSYFKARGEHEVAAAFETWIAEIELPTIESLLAEIGIDAHAGDAVSGSRVAAADEQDRARLPRAHDELMTSTIA